MRGGTLRRTALTAIALIAIVAIGFVALAWRPAIPIVASPPKPSDSAQLKHGAELAAIGNCITCHTREDGRPYAGGRPIVTPFGTVYVTNITPDWETGIGGWSADAFTRAMRDGVRRDGAHLYPAFPYDHMTKMREDDIRAVYAFLMTRRPVRATAPANELSFPFNIRAAVAGWKLLFLDKGVLMPNPSQNEDWNRGAYLVEGLGHCGACHTPRNALGAEKRNEAYAGGETDGWIAPALNAASPAAVPWDAKRLHGYLRTGFDDLHGVAAGPMAQVVQNLKGVSDKDVQAIAVYVASVAGAATPERQARASKAMARAKGEAGAAAKSDSADAGAAVYAGACAQCHGEAGRDPLVRALNLTLSSTLRNPRPDNVIRIVRDGINPVDGGAGAIMPGFAQALTDARIAALVNYLRASFTDNPPWRDVEEAVRRTKRDDKSYPRSAGSAQVTP